VLGDWLEAEPEALGDGEISFFRAEILAAAGRLKPAIDELERVLAQKESSRRPIRRKECLMLAADLYKKLGMTEKAAAMAKTIADKLPPSRS
jgi:tetratricopeptide (TPR) repeat protein